MPTRSTFFRPMKSANLPENGRDNPAEMVNKPIIQPLSSAPSKLVITAFISGNTKLKLIVKKNIEKQIDQKFLLYPNKVALNYAYSKCHQDVKHVSFIFVCKKK